MLKRAILQILMDSPLYFSYSLNDRLHLFKRALSKAEAPSDLQGRLSHWVKTGHFKKEVVK